MPGSNKADLQAKKNPNPTLLNSVFQLFPWRFPVSTTGLRSSSRAQLLRHPFPHSSPASTAEQEHHCAASPSSWKTHPVEKGNFYSDDFWAAAQPDRAQVGRGASEAAWDESKAFTFSWCSRKHFWSELLMFKGLDLPTEAAENVNPLWCSVAIELLTRPVLSHQPTFPAKRISGRAASFCAGGRKSMHWSAVALLKSTPQIRSRLSACLHISAGASTINLNRYKHSFSSPFWCQLFQQAVHWSCSNFKGFRSLCRAEQLQE